MNVVRKAEDIPRGCGGAVVSPTVAVHVLIQGVVDVEVELTKCEKKLDLAKMNLKKIIDMEAKSDSLPANVRLANEEKVRLRD